MSTERTHWAYGDPGVDTILSQLVEREVVHNCSCLMGYIGKAVYEFRSDEVSEEDVMDIMVRRATPADAGFEEGFRVTECNGLYFWHSRESVTPGSKDVPPEGYTILERPDGWVYADPAGAVSIDVLRPPGELYVSQEDAIEGAWEDWASQGGFTDEEEAWEDCITENRIEVSDYDADVYEHWIVTDFLARKLEALGQATKEILNLQIWGRCCTGQSITMDDVILEIAKGMEILPGQKYSWDPKDIEERNA